MSRRVATVFGGSGFVGRHLVRRLAAEGWIVRVGVRDPEAASFLKPMGEAGQVVPLFADVTDRTTVEPLVAGATAVINLVGILFERGRRTFERVHAGGAETVAQCAAASGAGRVIHMSAIGADPESSAAYARTKAAGEAAVFSAFPSATVHRASVIFGPEDNFFNQFALMAKFSPALPVFPTNFQPVYVADVADAFMKSIDDRDTFGKTYELGGPRVISFREIMEIVLRETHRKRILLPLPLTIAAVQGSILGLLPKPPLTRDQVRLLETDNVVAPGALGLTDLGITPSPVETIVPGYLRRYRDPVHQATHSL